MIKIMMIIIMIKIMITVMINMMITIMIKIMITSESEREIGVADEEMMGRCKVIISFSKLKIDRDANRDHSDQKHVVEVVVVDLLHTIPLYSKASFGHRATLKTVDFVLQELTQCSSFAIADIGTQVLYLSLSWLQIFFFI